MRGHWTHGMADTKLYKVWWSMVARCKYPSSTSWKWYGGKGIQVCERWLKFENFVLDMGAPPTPKHTLERKDSGGNYEPENCKWATTKEQSNNRTNNLFLKFRGKTQTARQWADELGLNYDRVIDRKYKGWSDEEALTEPLVGATPISFNGKTLSRHEWAKVTGIKANTIWWRLNKGWTAEKALTTPLLK